MDANAAIRSKTRALAGEYLGAEDLDHILSAQDLAECLERIRSVYPIDPEEPADATAFQRALVLWYNQELGDLLPYLTTKEHRFFRDYLLIGELDELRRYLELLRSGEELDRLHFVRQAAYADLLHFEKGRSEHLIDFLKKQRGRPYFRALEPYTRGNLAKEALDLKILELNLDRWYYHTLFHDLEGLGQAGEGLRAYYGVVIDLRMIRLLLHGKLLHQHDSNYWSAYLMDGGKLVKNGQAQLLLELDFRSMERWIEKSPYRSLLEGGHISPFTPIQEQRILHRMAHQGFHRERHNLLAAFYFAELLQGRMRDLRRIIEAKELGLEKEEIRPYLVEGEGPEPSGERG